MKRYPYNPCIDYPENRDALIRMFGKITSTPEFKESIKRAEEVFKPRKKREQNKHK